jgi:ferrochelatase
MKADMELQAYDALLIVSFGGPEKREDVIPFIENVLRGRAVPRERMLEVAEHYYHFEGRSPINQQCRDLIAAIESRFAAEGPKLPVYWGNRNWHPMLADTLGRMKAGGVKRALAFFTSAYSSYSGCRQYREDIAAAQEAVGEGAPQVEKLRVFFNHPGFVEPQAELVAAALAKIPAERRAQAKLVFTAHSIPVSMADTCDYRKQIEETCRLVSGQAGRAEWRLVWQSRSGSPGQPWLEPDIKDSLRDLAGRGARDVLVVPVGFISDHLEVLYDLDYEALGVGRALGLNMVRAATVGTHPKFIGMIRELVLERMGQAEKRAMGPMGPWHDVCPEGCCPAPQRPASSSSAAGMPKR